MRPRMLLPLALATVLLLLASAPFTAVGTRALIDLVNRVPILDIGYTSGHLSGVLELSHVRVELKRVAVTATTVAAEIDTGCLWRSALCLETLTSDALEVVIRDGGESSPDPQPLELLQIPYPVEVRAVEIADVSVTWPGGHWKQGRARGAVTLVDSIIRVVDAKLDEAELRVSEAAGDNGSTAETIRLPAIDLPLDLRVEDLELHGGRLSIPGMEYRLVQLQLRGAWSRQQLSLERVRIQTGDGVLDLDGTLAFEQNWPVSASARLHELSSEPYGLGEVNGRLSGDFARANLQVASGGDLNAHLDGDLNLLAAGIPFKARVVLDLPPQRTLSEFVSLPERLADARLAGPAEALIHGDLQSQAVAVNAAVEGAGYRRLALRLEGRREDSEFAIHSLLVRDEASDSSVSASGTVNWGDHLSIGAQLRSPGMDLPVLAAIPEGRIAGEGRVELHLQGEEWQLSIGEMAISGEVNRLPAELEGRVTLASGLVFSDTRLAGQVNGASIDVDAPREAGGELIAELRLSNLALWHPDARGILRVTARRAAVGGSLVVDGLAQQLFWQGLSVATARLYGILGGGQADLVLDLQSLDYFELDLASAQLTARGSLSQHRVALVTRGDIEGTLVLLGSEASGAWSGVLEPAQFDTNSGPWRLAQSVPLQWQTDDNTLSLAGHCWSHAEFSMCLGDTRLGATGSSSVTFAGDLDAFSGLLPSDLELSGGVDLQARAGWSPGSALHAELSALSEHVTVTRTFGLGEPIAVSWDRFTAQIQQGEAGVGVSSALMRGGREVLTAEVQIGSGPDRELQGVIRFDALQLQSAAPWTPELSRLEGTLTGEIGLFGTLAQPRPEGFLSLSNGYLALEGNPTELNNLNLQMQLSGEGAALSGKGLLGGGELKLDGTLNLSPQVQLRLDAVGADHQLLLPPSAELLVSEELSLSIVPGLVDIRGTVRVHEGVLHHEELPEGSVALSPDVVEVDLAGNPISEESPWKVRSDVTVHIRDRFEIQGDSLSATVGGDLHLRGEPDRPMQVFGNLNIVGGELRAYRQRLVIRRGTVAFSGPPEDPELSIRAERVIRSEGVTVGASLQGRLSEPVLEVYSDPPMTQGETMSYLVRGRGLDSGSGADGTALALAMGADVVNRSGIVSSINRVPGISNVAFGSTGSNEDTAATVSGYLGERIYLSYGIGLYEPINVLTARLYLQSRLWLEVVSRLEKSVDIYYSFDLD